MSIDPKSYTEAKERSERFDNALVEYLRQHPFDSPEWSTPAPYKTMLAATERYAEAALKDAIWGFAQIYVDIAATGYFGRAESTHVEVPAEFQDLFKAAIEAVQKANAPTPAEEIEQIYLRLWDIMWDAITVGVFPRISLGVGVDVAIIRGHLFANETALKQAAETIYEVKSAMERIGPAAVSLTSWAATGGGAPVPRGVLQLVAYTEDAQGRETPPIWAEIHTAVIGTPILAEIARRSGADFRQTLKDATGVPAVQSMGAGVTDIMDAFGGVAGALTWVGLLVGGIALFRFATKG